MNKATIIRTVILGIALVNQGLTIFGYSPIPFDEEQVTEFLSTAFLGVTAVWTWWKNNPVTKEAKWADQKKDKYKAEKKLNKSTGKAPVMDEDSL